MPICPKCNIEYKLGKNFCIRCGKALVEKPIQEYLKPEIQSKTVPKKKSPLYEEPALGRSRKRISKIIRISLFLLVAVLVVVIFFRPPHKRGISPMDPKIVELLTKAREYIAADKLTSPAGENALEVSEEILSLDPQNQEVETIKKEIAAKYEEWGDENYNEGSYQKAINYYKKSLSVDGNNPKIQEKLSQAERILKEQRILEETSLKTAEQKRLSELNIHLPLFSRAVIEKVISLGETPYELLFLDNFESNKHNWSLEDKENGPYLQIKNGQLFIEQRAKDQSYWEWINLQHDNFIVRFNMSYESGNENSAAGIFFRAESFNDYRHFIALDLKGTCFYGLGYYDYYQNKWVYIKNWTKSDTIRPSQNNKVEAILLGDTLYLYINGTFITSAGSLKNVSGKVFGFAVTESNARYSFDDLCVIELKKRS